MGGRRMSNPVELLRRALDALIAQDETICAEFCCTEIWDSPPIIEEIRAFLGENNIPLYTISKPTSKPMTSNERLQGFIELRDRDDGVHLLSFLAGICFAEKHYRIGDEE
jgi:tRNA G18 (ribose-2'-O)-methylase SpoU